MSIRFNADEIFEIAEQIERNGARFYRRAAEGGSAGALRDVLLDLAAKEDEHLATFAAMREDLSAGESRPTVFDPDDVGGLYLQAMADGHVFDMHADPTEKLSGQDAPEDILKTAIGLEKDSIVYYIGLREIVPEKLGRDKVEEIIREEERHVVILSKELASLRE